MHVFFIRTQIDNRITDKLPDAVISDFAAAIGFVNFRAERFQNFRRRQNAAGFCPPPDGKSVWMFQKQQKIARPFTNNFSFERVLKFQTGGVTAASEPPNF